MTNNNKVDFDLSKMPLEVKRTSSIEICEKKQLENILDLSNLNYTINTQCINYEDYYKNLIGGGDNILVSEYIAVIPSLIERNIDSTFSLKLYQTKIIAEVDKDYPSKAIIKVEGING